MQQLLLATVERAQAEAGLQWEAGNRCHGGDQVCYSDGGGESDVIVTAVPLLALGRISHLVVGWLVANGGEVAEWIQERTETTVIENYPPTKWGLDHIIHINSLPINRFPYRFVISVGRSPRHGRGRHCRLRDRHCRWQPRRPRPYKGRMKSVCEIFRVGNNTEEVQCCQ